MCRVDYLFGQKIVQYGRCRETAVADIDVYKEWLGIPEGERPPNHYTLLRLVQFEDDAEKIQSNYRKLNAHVRKYATGKYLKQSQELLNEMAKAMLCLTDVDSKREYDTSLGREPHEDESGEPETALAYLVSKGVIKRSQVTEIERFADARGLSHRDAVIQMKLADPIQATQAYAVELRMPYVDLDDMLPEDDALDRLPRQVVKRHACLPLFEDRGKMMVACVDEPTPELEDEIRMRYGMPMRVCLLFREVFNRLSPNIMLRECETKLLLMYRLRTRRPRGSRRHPHQNPSHKKPQRRSFLMTRRNNASRSV